MTVNRYAILHVGTNRPAGIGASAAMAWVNAVRYLDRFHGHTDWPESDYTCVPAEDGHEWRMIAHPTLRQVARHVSITR